MAIQTMSLEETAQALVAPGKGILAADESSGTIKKRFDSIGVESTEENRRAYRDLLFTTEGAEDFVSGVILYDETIRQSSADGTPFPKLLESKGVIPGIKVDTGAKDLANAPGEKVTEGLDGLRDRLAEYHELGARFAKWRAVITIGPGIPSEYCLWANAHALARYGGAGAGGRARPDRRARGADGRRPLDRARFDVTSRTLHAVFTELRDQRVHFEQMLLKPNMVLSGYEASDRRPATTRSPSRRSAASAATCRRRCRGSSSSPAARSDEDATARPQRDERAGPAPVGALVLVRPRAPGAVAQGVGAARRRTSRPPRRPTTTAPR